MRITIPNLLLLLRTHQARVLDVEEELQFHIEMLELEFARQGMGVAQAKAAAEKRFGNVDKIKSQCVDISRRNGLLQRILKRTFILVALLGLAIHMSGSEYKVVRIGNVLIMIAVCGRLLLYVRGLSPWTFLPGSKDTSLSVTTKATEDDVLS